MSRLVELVAVQDLQHGDTVEINGSLETVSAKNIKHCSFMGWTYKGDTHRHGIKRVWFIVPTAATSVARCTTR